LKLLDAWSPRKCSGPGRIAASTRLAAADDRSRVGAARSSKSGILTAEVIRRKASAVQTWKMRKSESKAKPMKRIYVAGRNFQVLFFQRDTPISIRNVLRVGVDCMQAL